MKKIGKILLLFVFSTFLFFCSSSTFFGSNSQTANALGAEVTYSNYQSSFDLEAPLFQVLLSLENEVNNENDTGFSSSFFTTGYASASPTSADGIAIKSDLASHELNLTTGANSPYDCLKDMEEKIADISGLNNLDLSEITSLILDDNSISVVSSGDLSGLTSISIISVCNNTLSSFAINPTLSGKITQLYLRGNSLSQIDLSDLALNAQVDLAQNLFESVDDITFGGTLTHLDLSFNNITEVPSLPLSLGCTPVFLMQGLNKEIFVAGDKIAVSNDNVCVEGLVVHVKYFAGDSETTASEYYEDSSDILSSAGTIGFNQIELPAGKLEISFSYVTNIDIPEEDEVFFENMFVASKIPAPNVVALSNGSEITTYSQNSPMNFTFSLNLGSNVVNSSQVLSDAVIYSGISGSEEENVATYNITSYASNSLSSYYVFDGITGEKTTIYASYTKASNTTLAFILIVIFFVVIACVVYVVRWIRNGSPIAPLTDSEMFREKRRQEKRQTGVDFPYAKSENSDEVVDLSSQNVSTDDGEVVDLIKDSENHKNNDEKGRYRKWKK